MYDSPKSDLINEPEIKHLGVIKILLLLFVGIGFIESFDLLNFTDIDEFDLWFSAFYAGLSILIAYFILRDIRVKPKTAYIFPGFFGFVLLAFAGINAVDDEANIFSDVFLVAVEAALMLTVSFILKTNFKSGR